MSRDKEVFGSTISKAILAAVAAVAAMPLTGLAAIRTWDGSENDGLWATTLNWDGTPNFSTSSDGAKFVDVDLAQSRTVTLPSVVGVNSLEFANSAGWTLTGTGTTTLNIGWNKVKSSGSGTNTLAVTVRATDTITFDVGTGNTLLLTGLLNTSSQSSVKTGNGTLRLAGTISEQYDYTSAKPLSVSAGVLELGMSSGNGLYYARATGTGTIKLLANNQFAASQSYQYINADTTGIIDLNDFSAAVKKIYVGSQPVTGVTGNGGGTINLKTGNLSGTTLNMKGGTISASTGILTLSGTVTTEAFATSSVIGSSLTLATGAGSFVVGDGAAAVDLDVTGALGGSVALTKSGAGLMRLSAENTNSGALSVTNGTLLVSGSGSINNASSITINGSTAVLDYSSATSLTKAVSIGAAGGKFLYNSTTPYSQGTSLGSGAVLGGSGTVGAVTSTGGTLAPGNSPGTLTTGSLSLDSSSILSYDLSASNTTVGGGINDYLIVNGDLTLDGTLNLTSLTDLATGTYTLVHYTGNLDDKGLLVGANFGNTNNQSYSIQIDNLNKNVNLAVVIPEPAAMALFVAAAALGVARRRRLD